MNDIYFMYIFPAWMVAIVAGVAAILRIKKKRWEDILPRLIITVVYIYLQLDPLLDFNVRAFLARWSLVLLLLVEVIWELSTWFCHRRKR